MKTPLLVLAASLLAFTACKKDIKTLKDPSATNTTQQGVNSTHARSGPPITLRGDVLNFDTQQTFDSLIGELETQQTEFTFAGFTPLYHTYNEVMAAEDAQMTAFVNSYSSVDDAIAHKDLYVHSTIYSNNTDILDNEVFSDGEPYVTINLFSLTIAKLTNKYGFVIIDNTLYHYTKDMIYSTTTFDPAQPSYNLSNTLNAGKLQDATYVLTPSGKPESTCECNNSNNHWVEKTYTGQLPKQRHQLQVVFTQQNKTSEGHCYNESKLYVTGKHFKKHIFGSWVSANVSSMYFEGAFNGPRTPSVNFVYYSPGYILNYTIPNFNYPDPFTQSQCVFYNVSGVTFTHFTDKNRSNNGTYLPCFYVNHATYKMGTMQGPIPNSWTIISW